jgi:hypothetical protein
MKIYKLASPKKFAWMDIQITPTQSICSKVYYLNFWYKPSSLPDYSDTENYRKVCDGLTRQELKTRNDFKGVKVNYGIFINGKGKGIGPHIALPGEYFGVYQVIDMKSDRNAMLDNAISINDENNNFKYYKAFPLNNVQIRNIKKDKKEIKLLEGASRDV